MYLDNLNLLARGMVIMFSIAMFAGAMSILTNVIKSKDCVCDNEKKSKFILECLKADTTKDVRAFQACENISKKLYCK